MIPRLLQPEVEESLNRQAAVAILGPRQVGKTTLALSVAAGRPAHYLDLQDPSDRAKLQEPALYCEQHRERLLILDEIHRVPELFSSLRGIIDQGRRSGHGVGRFLILGSASLSLLRQSSESLAGRIAHLELTPLSALEVLESDLHSLWLRGGWPMSYLAGTDAQSAVWRRDFIRTFLERDLAEFGPRIPAETMRRLWTMLAHRQGQLLNASDLARALDTSPQTVVRYLDLLVDLQLVRRLQPYHANVEKRLVKSPKIFLRDSGILHALLDVGTWEALQGHPIVGASFEGFALESLLSHLLGRVTPFFYRTAGGAEIDLLLEHPSGELTAIEIKRSLRATLSRGYQEALSDLQPSRRYLLHAGQESFPLKQGVMAIGLQQLAQELRESTS